MLEKPIDSSCLARNFSLFMIQFDKIMVIFMRYKALSN